MAALRLLQPFTVVPATFAKQWYLQMLSTILLLLVIAFIGLTIYIQVTLYTGQWSLVVLKWKLLATFQCNMDCRKHQLATNNNRSDRTHTNSRQLEQESGRVANK